MSYLIKNEISILILFYGIRYLNCDYFQMKVDPIFEIKNIIIDFYKTYSFTYKMTSINFRICTYSWELSVLEGHKCPNCGSEPNIIFFPASTYQNLKYQIYYWQLPFKCIWHFRISLEKAEKKDLLYYA